jgi:membrane protease YdiL (CAAX protease family)
MSEVFPEAAPELPPLPEEPPRETFTATKAFVTFALVMLGQFIAGFAVILAGMIAGAIAGQNVADSKFIDGLMTKMQAPLLIAVILVSTIVVAVVTRIWAWNLAHDRSDEGLGVRGLPGGVLAVHVAIGFVIALVYLGLSRLIPMDPTKPVGPLTEIAASGGLSRVALLIAAVFYAPVVEEFLFRGLLFKGFSTSWGVVKGGVVVTVLFVLLHLAETWHYWPGTVAITTMAVATLFARMRTRSLAAPIALHFAYNATIIAAVYAL